jgi:hypothetical protein
MNKTTIVTGLWDIGRGHLQDGWSRNFQHYLNKFDELLSLDVNLIIFGDEELKKFVFERRTPENTQFITRDLTWFVNNDFYQKIQKIRTNPQWFNQVGWLSESTQSKLEMYNPLVMSKMFLLHDAKILDRFNSENLFWIDAGLTNTVHKGYFTTDKVLDKISNFVDKFMFITFPYETSTEIHGFKYDAINTYSNERVNRVARGGFFGGKKDSIPEINTIYYHLLKDTLDNGYMGTEESIFTIMTYLYPNLIDIYNIESSGLLGKFFEDVKNGVHDKTNEIQFDPTFFVDKIVNTTPNIQPQQEEVALYVIGFNSPNQFKTLIKSMLEYDEDFITKPKKYLLNNSTDRTTDFEYEKLCYMYNFEIIGNGTNLGICGGRQFVAEHFDTTNHKFYWWFEDDMFFYPKKGEVCRNGFNRYVPNFYNKTLNIIKKENFDFLKINFSEFFGDNSVNWSWYNVPQPVRETYFPTYPKLPQQGLDPNAPKTTFNNIKSLDGVPYATGEIYYCNWVQIVSKEGNKKMFLDTTWVHPYEQTWMSHIFQETKKGKINGGLLLMTPTEHNRFDHYPAESRKES